MPEPGRATQGFSPQVIPAGNEGFVEFGAVAKIKETGVQVPEDGESLKLGLCPEGWGEFSTSSSRGLSFPATLWTLR